VVAVGVWKKLLQDVTFAVLRNSRKWVEIIFCYFHRLLRCTCDSELSEWHTSHPKIKKIISEMFSADNLLACRHSSQAASWLITEETKPHTTHSVLIFSLFQFFASMLKIKLTYVGFLALVKIASYIIS